MSKPRLEKLFPHFAALFLGFASLGFAEAPALKIPEKKILKEAQSIVETMRNNYRGPYLRLRWWCNDGSILPPTSYACVPHGGGHQHAEYSPDQKRLAALGWHVGTILTPLKFEELWDAKNRNQRLREIVVERYLLDTGDGWIMKRARAYRGRIQIEDEEEYGRRHLIKMLEKNSWVQRNFLLAREVSRSLPHHGGVDRTRVIRRLAQEVSEGDPRFEDIRVKVHSNPGSGDIATVSQWIKGQGASAPEAIRETAQKLVSELTQLYGPNRDWIGRGLETLPKLPPFEAWGGRLRELPKLKGLARIERLGGLLRGNRELIIQSSDGAANLSLLDLSLEIEQEFLRDTLLALRAKDITRRRLLRLSRSILLAGYGAGFLSGRETRVLGGPIAPLLKTSKPSPEAYRQAVKNLRRASAWALGTVQRAFAEPLIRYGALEPRAYRFVDDLVRGSPLLALSQAIRALTLDLDELSGKADRLFGKTFTGALALNPGLAQGTLRWVEAHDTESLTPQDIAVLAKTVSYLPPVAGILSLDEGNLLSHVQLLARNLGIPNASVTPDLASQLKALNGTEVMFVVGQSGSVVLEKLKDLPRDRRAELSGALQETAKVQAPVPNLLEQEPLALHQLHAGLSGKIVGPKAANLGELARMFPGRVAPAVALPFGYFHRETSAGPTSPRALLNRAYQDFRAGKLSEPQLAETLEKIRGQIESIRLADSERKKLKDLLQKNFGAPGSYGLFLRSDTNVEDLPGFTGAGLNKTIPHVTQVDKAIDSIPSVWASVLSSRSIAWRSGVLSNPEQVYSSVLLMRSVEAEKSGVLVTKNLIDGGPGLTVTTAWGVGGGVDGESSETVVLKPDNTYDLVSEAKATYQRSLLSSGGVGWIPAPSGRVLTGAEQQVLRAFAKELTTKRRGAIDANGNETPWDVEFGFRKGKLELFQVRPLVERGHDQADQMIRKLIPQTRKMPTWIPINKPALQEGKSDQ